MVIGDTYRVVFRHFCLQYAFGIIVRFPRVDRERLFQSYSLPQLAREHFLLDLAR